MEKKYIATFDDGHDYITVQYKSLHRNGSRANREDALRAYRRQNGWSRAVTLKSTVKYDW